MELLKKVFDYEGKTVVVTGAAGTGMGGVTTKYLIELGADVYALDIKEVTAPVKKYIACDLMKKESVERAAKQVPAKIDCLFNCAGNPGPGSPFTPLETTTVNFIGHRHLTEMLIPQLVSGGAIAIISSAGGRGWRLRIEIIKELLEITDWDKAYAWLEAHPDVNDGYVFSKECLIVYAKWRAPELARRDIRINCISPGATTTPMFNDYWAGMMSIPEALNAFQGYIGRNATPEEMAWPLLFLNSKMASYLSGENINVDYGKTGGVDLGLSLSPTAG